MAEAAAVPKESKAVFEGLARVVERVVNGSGNVYMLRHAVKELIELVNAYSQDKILVDAGDVAVVRVDRYGALHLVTKHGLDISIVGSDHGIDVYVGSLCGCGGE